MPSLAYATPAVPPVPPSPLSPSLRRLHLSSHLRFLDAGTPPQALSSHYRALLLDACETAPSLRRSSLIWQLLESILLHSPTSSLPTCLPPATGSFWGRVSGHALRGELASAHSLVSARLREAPDWPSRVASLRLRDGRVDPLAALEHVLEGGEGPEWRSAVAMWAACEELVGETEIQQVMQLLTGESEAMRRVASGWVELFVGLVVHGNGLREAIEHAFDMVDESGELGMGDWRILKNAIEGEYAGLLELLHRVHGAFIAAHFGDILFRKGLIDTDLRGIYIRHYCRLLQTTPGNWRLSVDYTLRIPAKHSIQPLLSSVPITGAGDPTAEKLYMVAARTGHTEAVCKRLAAVCSAADNYGGCMNWLARGRLYDDAGVLAEKVVSDAERAGPGSEHATRLAYVVAAIRQGDDALQRSLAHVVAYHDFQECAVRLAALEEGDAARGELVRDICISATGLFDGLPRRFWVVVVYDTARLLKAEDAEFVGRGAVTKLLHALDAPTKALEARLHDGAVEVRVRECRTLLTKLFSRVV